MSTRVIAVRDEAAAAAGAAEAILAAFRAATNDGVRFALALSGGRIAPRLYAALLDSGRSPGRPLGSADFFWADERCVPPGDPDSNYSVARTRLLEPLGVPAERIHRLAGEEDPARAAEAAGADWRRWQALRGGPESGPDLVILGVGEDGHVASLFPENLAVDLAAVDPFRAVVGPKPPPRRLTMGYPLLWTAGTVVVLATGAGKEAVVTGSLSGRLDTPLARVLSGRATRNAPSLVFTAFPPASDGAVR